MGGASVLGAQRRQCLLGSVTTRNRHGKRNEAAFADVDVGMGWLRQGIDRQSILPLRGSGYYRRREFPIFLP